MSSHALSPDDLRINAMEAVDEIALSIRETIHHRLRRKGAVLGLSGGIDSSVTAALCVRALGRDRVIGLLMPEKESSLESLMLGKTVATWLGIRHFVEDITPILEAAGCYERRDAAIRTIVPEYGEGDRCKVVLPDLTEHPGLPVYSIVVQPSAGAERRIRLSADAHLGILAANSLKQRTRKMLEYAYADRFQFAVVGTPNRLEYDQGFFVKNGDGAADLKPIAHLYKSQVYQVAASLGVPEEVRQRPPTTDTYPLEQSQEEFYFSVPLELMDFCLLGLNRGIPPEEVAEAAGLTPDRVRRVYRLIETRRTTSHYLHQSAILVEPVSTEDRPSVLARY